MLRTGFKMWVTGSIPLLQGPIPSSLHVSAGLRGSIHACGLVPPRPSPPLRLRVACLASFPLPHGHVPFTSFSYMGPLAPLMHVLGPAPLPLLHGLGPWACSLPLCLCANDLLLPLRPLHAGDRLPLPPFTPPEHDSFPPMPAALARE